MPSLVKIATYSDTCKTLEPLIENKTGIPVVVRMGGTMNYSEYPIQINSKFSVQNSVNKLMLHMLCDGKPYILPFIASYGNCCSIFHNKIGENMTQFVNKTSSKKIISRPLGGSGGEEIIIDSLYNYIDNSDSYLENRIVTPFINVTSEYRFFATQDEIFYIYKKIKKQDKKEDLFITRQNHFIKNINDVVKPRLLKEMKEAVLETMKIMGLEIAALDIIYDSSDKENHKFYIVETNTGPEMSNQEIKNAVASAITKLINKKNQ